MGYGFNKKKKKIIQRLNYNVVNTGVKYNHIHRYFEHTFTIRDRKDASQLLEAAVNHCARFKFVVVNEIYTSYYV